MMDRIRLKGKEKNARKPELYNRVLLIGTLPEDPELRYITPDGALLGFKIEVRRAKWEKRRSVTISRKKYEFDIRAFGRWADLGAEYFKKGSRVVVIGRLAQEQYEFHGYVGARTVIFAQKITLPDSIKLPLWTFEKEVSETVWPLLQKFRARLHEMPPAQAVEIVSRAADPFIRLYNRHRQSLSVKQRTLWPEAKSGLENPIKRND